MDWFGTRAVIASRYSPPRRRLLLVIYFSGEIEAIHFSSTFTGALLMLTNLALLAILFAEARQAEDLSLGNARLTHGITGLKRAHAKVLPGDSLVVSFDILGITADEDGKVRYSIGTELSDARGKVLFRQPATDQEMTASLGGGHIPAFAQADVGLDLPAGEYGMKVMVTDRATKKSASLTQQFTVLPKAFGLVRLNVSRDPDGHLPVMMKVAGETAWFHLAVVGFARPKPGGQPSVQLEVRILDDKDKPTIARPLVGTVDKDVPASALSLPLQFPLVLNRAGKFTLHLKLTDNVSRKTVEYSAPFIVHAPR